MRTDARTMTSGNPWKLIFFFAVPLMLGNIFHEIYYITDGLIVSRTLGVSALAALGAVDWFAFMMISMIQAAAQGFAILMAQNYGAGDLKRLQKTVAHSITLTVILSVVLTAAAFLIMEPMFVLENIPAEIVPVSRAYISVIFGGLPVCMLMNFGNAVLRAFGNSKSPLVGMVLSSVVNIGLDLMFVRVFGWGVTGAASATVISQALAGLYCLMMIRHLDFLYLSREDFGRVPGLNGHLLKLSWPMMLQNLIIAVGGIIVQSQVNTFDLAHIAGYAATNKLYSSLELAAVAYGFAMVTYIGQNYGAGLYDRIRKGIKAGVLIGIATGLLIGAVMILFGHYIIGAFLTGDAATVAEAEQVGYEFLFLMSAMLPVLYVLHVIRSTLQGFGNTMVTMLSGVAEFAARVTMAVVVSRFIGWPAMIWAEIAAWLASDVILAFGIRFEMKKGELHTI